LSSGRRPTSKSEAFSFLPQSRVGELQRERRAKVDFAQNAKVVQLLAARPKRETAASPLWLTLLCILYTVHDRYKIAVCSTAREESYYLLTYGAACSLLRSSTLELDLQPRTPAYLRLTCE